MLLTPEIKAKMLENGRNPEADPHPAVKLFVPFGSATWLLTELDPQEPDIAFGLCDLGQGFPELGYVSISELESIRLFNNRVPAVERDESFEAKHPLSVYTAAAAYKHRIVESGPALEEAAAKNLPRGPQPG